ncbi:MAG: hypothetical protein ISR95_02835 [Candidatus Marinimicrobia bacterium]|nr:hypothetical protein [Candidatus Neomarinimicrobiota bacterium]
MKFFKPRLVDGGVLYDGDNTANMPVLQKLETSRKMNRDKTGRVFAAFTRAEEQALAQLIREQK